MSDNVIKFPKANKRAPSLEDLQRASEVAANTYSAESINTALEIASTNLFAHLKELGYELAADQWSINDCCFVREAIKSLLCRFYDVDHPYQMIADVSFLIDEETGTVVFQQPMLTKIPVQMVDGKPDLASSFTHYHQSQIEAELVQKTEEELSPKE